MARSRRDKDREERELILEHNEALADKAEREHKISESKPQGISNKELKQLMDAAHIPGLV